MTIPRQNLRFIVAAMLLLAGCASRPRAGNPPEQKSTAFREDGSDQAWQELQEMLHPPAPPTEWQTKPPTSEAIATWEQSKSVYAELAADLAKNFYTRYPHDSRAAEARLKEYRMLKTAVELGNTTQIEHLAQLERERLADTTLSKDERFSLMTDILARKTSAQQNKGTEAAMTELEAGAREMLKTFPDSPEVYQFLMTVAAQTQNPAKARRIAEEIVAGPADTDIKESAQILLHWLSRLGKPLKLQFTAVDGREVNLEKMPGKVVLVQFWASWCNYCAGELPVIKAAYEKLHQRGFEIVAINYDQSREDLIQFVAQNKIPWPQYFDGQGRNGPLAKEFEVFEIPTLWLVDKKGSLREIDVREGLAEKVEKLLAE